MPKQKKINPFSNPNAQVIILKEIRQLVANSNDNAKMEYLLLCIALGDKCIRVLDT